MNLDDLTRLAVTLNREQKIVIDGVVEIYISTGKHSKAKNGQVSLTICAPKEFRIQRKPLYPNSPNKE